MDNRQRQDLDNYITGHYGEDQFKDEEPDDYLCPDDLIDMTAHEAFCMLNNLNVYGYDPAADGPECEVITRILASHPSYILGAEQFSISDLTQAQRRDLFQRWSERGIL